MHRGVSVLGEHDAFDESLVADGAAMAAVVQELARQAREDRRTFVHGESLSGESGCSAAGCARGRTGRHRVGLVEVSAPVLHSTEQDRALFGDADLAGAVGAARGGTILVRCFEELKPGLQRRLLATTADDHRLVATLAHSEARVLIKISALTPPKIVSDAMALPPEEREELAAMLLDSLEPPAAISIDDVDEIDRRAEAARSGADPGVAWTELRKRLEG